MVGPRGGIAVGTGLSVDVYCAEVGVDEGGIEDGGSCWGDARMILDEEVDEDSGR